MDPPVCRGTCKDGENRKLFKKCGTLGNFPKCFTECTRHLETVSARNMQKNIRANIAKKV